MKKVLLIAVLLIVAIVIGLVFSGKRTQQTIDKQFAFVNSVVKAGMHFDEATAILEKNGFVLFDKSLMDKSGENSQVLVPLVDSIPIQSTIAEMFGTSSGLRVYAILIVSPSDKILAIEQ